MARFSTSSGGRGDERRGRRSARDRRRAIPPRSRRQATEPKPQPPDDPMAALDAAMLDADRRQLEAARALELAALARAGRHLEASGPEAAAVADLRRLRKVIARFSLGLPYRCSPPAARRLAEQVLATVAPEDWARAVDNQESLDAGRRTMAYTLRAARRALSQRDTEEPGRNLAGQADDEPPDELPFEDEAVVAEARAQVAQVRTAVSLAAALAGKLPLLPLARRALVALLRPCERILMKRAAQGERREQDQGQSLAEHAGAMLADAQALERLAGYVRHCQQRVDQHEAQIKRRRRGGA